MLKTILRYTFFGVASVATLISANVSGFGLLSLLADDYNGWALVRLGQFGLPAASAAFVFLIVAFATARRWPLYVTVAAILLGLGPAVTQPFSFEVELFVYRWYFIAQGAAFFSLTILILIDLKVLRKRIID